MIGIETATFIERTACISCGGGKLQELSAGRFDDGAVGRFIDADPWGEHPAPFLRGHRWSYVACADCGMAFHRFILSPEWNERRFTKWMSQEAIEAFERPLKTASYEFDRAVAFTSHALQIEYLTRTLRGEEALRLLDFGCGYGGFLSMCSMFGFHACGVDRAAAKRDNGSFAKVFADVSDVMPMAPFHALTLFEVLEHLDEPLDLMLRLRDLVVSGGILVLETPDCSGVRGIHTRDDFDKIHPLEHINGFTPQSLERFAVRLGFEPIRKPVACVTAAPARLAKSAIKRMVSPVLKPTTQRYFRKL
jgi:SAM-dependent methyltransferase